MHSELRGLPREDHYQAGFRQTAYNYFYCPISNLSQIWSFTKKQKTQATKEKTAIGLPEVGGRASPQSTPGHLLAHPCSQVPSSCSSILAGSPVQSAQGARPYTSL